MDEMGITSREAFGRELLKAVTAQQKIDWTKNLSLVQWANESYEIVRHRNVLYCDQVETRCQYTSNEEIYISNTHAARDGMKALNITAGYEDDHKRTVKTRIQQAGVRLAALFNEHLGK